jgi:hypothetical protein
MASSVNPFSALPEMTDAGNTAGSPPVAAPSGASAAAPQPQVPMYDDLPEYEDMETDGKEASIETVEASENKISTHILDKLPAPWQFKEFQDEKHNPYLATLPDVLLDELHREYRGSDCPKFVKFKTVNQQAQLHFLDTLGSVPGRPAMPMSVGYLDATPGTQAKKSLVSVSFHVDTQMPCIVIHIDRVDRPNDAVNYTIFANSLRTIQEDEKARGVVNLQLHTLDGGFIPDHPVYSEAKIKGSAARGYSNITELARNANLLWARVRLVGSDVDPKSYASRPLWSNISDSELKEIVNKATDNNLSKDMTGFEQTIWRLHTATMLDIFRQLYSRETASINKFKNCFLGSMRLCSLYRNFWFYQLQLGELTDKNAGTYKDIFAPSCELETLQPPRWMITKWRTYTKKAEGDVDMDMDMDMEDALAPAEEVSEDDASASEEEESEAPKDKKKMRAWMKHAQVLKTDPLNWSAYAMADMYPSTQDCAFLIRLALARERNAQAAQIKEMQEGVDRKSIARFEAMPHSKGIYKAYVLFPGAEGEVSELVKPDLETRVKMRVFFTNASPVSYDGHVVEATSTDEANRHGFDFIVQLFGHDHNFGQTQYEIEIDFIDDTTTDKRARKSLESMARVDVKREKGVDLPAIIFRSEFTIPPTEQNVLGRPETLSQEALNIVMSRVEVMWKLNVKQCEAVRSTFMASTGLSLVHGPPGTGKSLTATASAHEHARIGNKVLFTCPSNKAVDASLRAYCSKLPSNSKVKAVRFVGGYKTYEDRKKRIETSDDQPWDGLLSSTIEAARKANPDSLFHIQKELAIRTWATNADHAMHAQAKTYAKNLSKLEKLKGKDRQEAAKQVRILDEDLTDHFVETEVDIIFTTCASACHPVIAERFKPAIAFVDEAGQATVPDVCMALDPYREHVMALVLCGDHHQLPPVIVGKLNNEAAGSLGKSLFELLIEDDNKRFGHVMLNKQYRSNEALMDWSNKTFYGGQLTTMGIAMKGSKQQTAARHFFGTNLGLTWQGKDKVRIGIDVSGHNAMSVKSPNSTSFENHEEARIIVETVRRLLRYVDVAGRPPAIEPQHIGIFTPYKGQRQLIRKLLRTGGPDTPEAKVEVQGFLTTTWGIQGSEVEIGIISLVIREPSGDPMARMKFVANENALNVQNTRAKRFQITTGNFTGWCEALRDRTTVIHKRQFLKFGSLVRHFWENNDIVSWMDLQTRALATPDADGTLPNPPTASRFYTTDVPKLDMLSKRKKGPYEKSKSGPAFKSKKTAPGATVGTVINALSRQTQQMALDPQAKVSNRELKRQRRAAEERDKQKKAADRIQAERDMGLPYINPTSRQPSPPPPPPPPPAEDSTMGE